MKGTNTNMFDNPHYQTKRVAEELPVLLQLFLWQCVLDLKGERDYLQIFDLKSVNGFQWARHRQEQPMYSKEYMFPLYKPVQGKIYVIDSDSYSTMLFAEEY
jgi:hypothetical protein